MDLRDLQYFEVIAELEHVGRAAQRLHRSQPTLTNCLRRLEAESGGPLVERHGRGIRLTEAGKVLRKLATKSRLAMQDARTELAYAVSGHSGEVRVGLIPSAAQFLLPQIMQSVFVDMPEVLIRSEVATHATLEPKLQNGELDFIIVGDRHPPGASSIRPLASDVVVPAAARRHPIFRTKPVTVTDLARYRWILQPLSFPHRQWIEEVFRRAQLPPPHVQMETNMLNLQPALIAASGLLTVLPRLQLATDGVLREIEIPGVVMRRKLEIRTRVGAYTSPAASRLMDMLTRSLR